MKKTIIPAGKIPAPETITTISKILAIFPGSTVSVDGPDFSASIRPVRGKNLVETDSKEFVEGLKKNGVSGMWRRKTGEEK
jgi:hypothetical protein